MYVLNEVLASKVPLWYDAHMCWDNFPRALKQERWVLLRGSVEPILRIFYRGLREKTRPLIILRKTNWAGETIQFFDSGPEQNKSHLSFLFLSKLCVKVL